ncbi:MAG TPA: hypothetical protein DCZ95_03385 [Verrucomicrobia bacterium]|nr:MAG: hypothetical protein A2X46_01580 [Lentisphaerae bacterium GWF2_57_35]HBA83116.1 hypothetical protein [Verrucomicrobiota bacterium]
MKRILAIASIAVRNAIRSKVVLILLAFLLLAILGLPLTIKDDGTVAGRVRLVLSYTLGAAEFILALATLWAGCSAISNEIDEKQIHLIVTKPVRHAQIWLGKWLGLMFVNAALLLVAGVAAYALLLWSLRPERLSDSDRKILAEQILIARKPCEVDTIDVAPQARRELESRQAQGQIPANVPPDVAYQAIHQTLLSQAYIIPPGQKHTWTFHLPNTHQEEHPLLVRFRFSSSMIGPAPTHVRWLAGPPSQPDRFRLEQENIPGPLYTLTIPHQVPDRGQPFLLTYENIHPEPVTIVFHPQDGLQLLAYAGSFATNYVRALLIVLFHLGLLTALGVTAGSLFSMPVASFVSIFVLILLGMSRLIQGIATQTTLLAPVGESGQAPHLWIILLRAIYKGLYAAIHPLQAVEDPLQMISTGICVPWSMVASVFGMKILLYTGALALLGVCVLNRREIALPGSH